MKSYKNKTIKQLENLAKNLVNEAVRLRDCQIINGELYGICYTCEKKVLVENLNFKYFHAGHRWKDKYYSSVRFDYHAIKGQCYNCNRFLHGNEIAFDMKLKNELGEEYNNLILKKNSTKHYLFSELVTTIEDAKEKIKFHKSRLGLK